MQVVKSFLRPILATALIILAPAVSRAQIQTGTITGVVTDQQSAILPGVSVTLTSPALIRQQTVVTNERGVYSFIALPPGSVRRSIRAPGIRADRSVRHPGQSGGGHDDRSDHEGGNRLGDDHGTGRVSRR